MGLWPENTLLAFRNALEHGIDVLETDIHRTRDGVIVISHDQTVDSNTDGSGAIKEMTLSELKSLDAGYQWSKDEEYPLRGQGITIPTLEEALDAFPNTTFNIDIKPNDEGVAADFCNLLKRRGDEQRVIVGSFHGNVVKTFRRRCPEVRTAASFGETLRFYLYTKVGLDRIFGPNAHAFQVPRTRWFGLHLVTPEFVRAAHQRGIKVHVWTINDRDEMRELIEMGVDGIMTDFPDLLEGL